MVSWDAADSCAALMLYTSVACTHFPSHQSQMPRLEGRQHMVIFRPSPAYGLALAIHS